MSFQVVWPLVQRVDGDSFKSAIKNFVKMNRRLNIEKIIITDQQKHMQATFDYFKYDIRNRVGINFFPANPITLRNLGIRSFVTSPIMSPLMNPLMNPSINPRRFTNTVINSRSGLTSLVSPSVLRPNPLLPNVGVAAGNLRVGMGAPIIASPPLANVITPTGPFRGPGVDVGPRVGTAVPLSNVGLGVPSSGPVITSRQAPGIIATPTTVVVGNNALGPLRQRIPQLRNRVSPIPMSFGIL
jgi:hypothetical protein